MHTVHGTSRGQAAKAAGGGTEALTRRHFPPEQRCLFKRLANVQAATANALMGWLKVVQGLRPIQARRLMGRYLSQTWCVFFSRRSMWFYYLRVYQVVRRVQVSRTTFEYTKYVCSVLRSI